MNVQIYTAPVLEPVTLANLKLHLRLDSGAIEDNLTAYQSLVPGEKAIANNYTTHVGTGVDVLGHEAIVYLNSGTNGAGGTVDVKIQESDDNITYADWTGGAFTQVTTANDNAIQEKRYTGTKQYIRTVAKVLVAACVFGTEIIVNEASFADDDKLDRLRKAARREVEIITSRALLTQTWDYYLNAWPSTDHIKIPFGNLQSVTSVSWKDSDGDETTLTENTDYLVETNGEGIGRLVLPYGETWPSGTLYPSNPIKIRFVCGWLAAASIPEDIITAVLFCAERMWYHGDRDAALTRAIGSLLYTHRIWDEFL